VVVLCGLRGTGNIQPNIHFVRRFTDTYSSLFWLNAKDETTLKARLATQVTEDHVSPTMTDPHKEGRIV